MADINSFPPPSDMISPQTKCTSSAVNLPLATSTKIPIWETVRIQWIFKILQYLFCWWFFIRFLPTAQSCHYYTGPICTATTATCWPTLPLIILDIKKGNHPSCIDWVLTHIYLMIFLLNLHLIHHPSFLSLPLPLPPPIQTHKIRVTAPKYGKKTSFSDVFTGISFTSFYLHS